MTRSETRTLDIADSTLMMEALGLLVQSQLKLVGDCDKSDVVEVGSTELFREGPGRPQYPIRGLAINTALRGKCFTEDVTICEISRLGRLRLKHPAGCVWRAEQGATIGLKDVPIQLQMPSVEEGRPEAIIDPATTALPAVTMFERSGEMQSDGGNRVYRQRRLIDLYYVRRRQAGEERGTEQRRAVEALINLLMADMYLGGTCSNSWVSGWDFEPQQREGYDWAALDVSRVELTVETWKLWDK